MPDRVLNWGLLSTAKINRSLIPPLKVSSRSQLLAVASRSHDSAEAYAQEWDIPRAWGNYEALFDDPDIDVIYNSLPNDLHADWTIKALRAGKHVLCEKPLALTLAEVDAMASAAHESGKILAEAFMYRHHAQTLKVKELVDSGGLGKLQFIRGSFTYHLTRETHRSDPVRGGGSIWDVGCYPINYARMITGAEPIEVFGQQVRSPSGIDETFVGQLRFPSDVFAQFDSGFNSPSRSQIEIVGTEAVLSISNPYKPGLKEIISLVQDDRTETTEVEGEELYLGEVEDMADAVLLGKTPRVSLSDSRGNTLAILALVESAKSGKPVSL